MSEYKFKVGDEVFYENSNRELWRTRVLAVDSLDESMPYFLENELWAGEDDLTLANPKQKPSSVVGFKPESETPIVFAPFTYDSDDFNIKDSSKRVVLVPRLYESEFGTIPDDKFHAFGEFVAEALNEKVQRES
jgi:hypothetical protein